MSSLQEIEQVITKFSNSDLQSFRIWFDEFDSKNWDEQFDNDVKTGKLKTLGEKAINDFLSNKFSEL